MNPPVMTFSFRNVKLLWLIDEFVALFGLQRAKMKAKHN